MATVSKREEALRKRFGARIAEARKRQLGLTQVEFAQRLEIDKDYYSRVERGAVHASDRLRQRIAQELGTSLTFLEREEGEPVSAGVAANYPNRATVLAGPDFRRAPDVVKDRFLEFEPDRDLTPLQWLELLGTLMKQFELGALRPKRPTN